MTQPLHAAIDLLEDDERFVTWHRLNFDRLNEIDDNMTYAATVRHYLRDVADGFERLAPEERPMPARTAAPSSRVPAIPRPTRSRRAATDGCRQARRRR
jgi:hypothetical protein